MARLTKRSRKDRRRRPEKEAAGEGVQAHDSHAQRMKAARPLSDLGDLGGSRQLGGRSIDLG
jgi:hypothetical protein